MKRKFWIRGTNNIFDLKSPVGICKKNPSFWSPSSGQIGCWEHDLEVLKMQGPTRRYKGEYKIYHILSHMWVGWLGRVLMWFEKLFGRLQDLVHFGSRSWKLLPFCFPTLPPWSPLRGDGEKVSMGFTLLSFSLVRV